MAKNNWGKIPNILPKLVLAFSIVLSLTLTGLFGMAPAQAETAVAASPQPEASTLKPGLAVDYYYIKLDRLDQLYAWLGSKKPDRGAPLETIDFVADQQGPVLGTNRDSIVAAIITGFVRFPESGQFKMLALVNDGMRLYIGQGSENPILDDPRKMVDRLVGPTEITVVADLWYPLKL